LAFKRRRCPAPRPEALTKARPDAHTGWSRRGLSPFDYRTRLGAVLADGPEGLTLIVKGAPEAVMEACASAGGAPFDAAAREAASARVHDMASNGLRSVAVASRLWMGPPRDPTPNDETNLVFEGLCTFADPPKASAPAAVARLAAAGVRVVILSGDDPLVVGRGHQAGVNVDVLPETLVVPIGGSRLRCSRCGGSSTPVPLGTQAERHGEWEGGRGDDGQYDGHPKPPACKALEVRFRHRWG
jgi:magnesium-transporting ATPase (P-type)